MLYHLESAVLKCTKTKVEWSGMEFFICYHQMFATLNMKWIRSHELHQKTTKTCLPSHACTRYESRKRQPHSYSQYTQNYAKIQRRMQTILNEFRRADTTTVNRIFIAHLHTMRSTFGMRGFAILFVWAAQEMGINKNAFRLFTIDMKCHHFP